jgi:pimeloyl-ACP methyl ester carboxylesterase
VWVTNTRGNKYSREHRTISPKDKAFWQFSFADMALDVRANADYVSKATGYKKVAYVGHSQGTSQMFTAMAEFPEWAQERISLFIALGPVARLDNSKSMLLSLLADVKGLLVTTMKTLGMHEVFPANYLTTTAMKAVCGTFPILCKGVNILFADMNPFEDDSALFGTYMGHNPSGTSLVALHHFAQVMKAKKFQHYDYGKKGNQEHYGQNSPPEIPLAASNGRVPTALFVGKNDELGDVKDNEWIASVIPDSITHHKVYAYGHLSFFVGKDMVWLYDMRELL